MKTFTREITVYTAAELKEKFPKGFARALQNHGDLTNEESFWHESVTEDFLSILALCGFTVEEKNVHWSGFCSQGDGASFTGHVTFAPDAGAKVREYAPVDETLHKLADQCGKYGAAGIRCRIERTCRHYSHENTVCIEAYTLDAEGDEIDIPDGFHQGDIADTCRGFMQWLYRRLEKEHEYRTSEECFLEEAEMNEWTFTPEGKIDSE